MSLMQEVQQLRGEVARLRRLVEDAELHKDPKDDGSCGNTSTVLAAGVSAPHRPAEGVWEPLQQVAIATPRSSSAVPRAHSPCRIGACKELLRTQWDDLMAIGVDSDSDVSDDDEAYEVAMEQLTSMCVARFGQAAFDAAVAEVGAERLRS